MKLIIDIPSEWEMIIKTMSDSEMVDFLYKTARNGTSIPDNATNGDVIKALFDVTEEHFFEDMVDVYGIDDYVTVDVNWWDAPYRKERTNDESGTRER